jgi:G:T/U-mismatch repair DNA glycosylase
MHKRNHFGEYCTILNAMPISEMFEEKIQVLQANKIGLWDVLKIETRKFRHSYQNQKENDFESLFRLFPISKQFL